MSTPPAVPDPGPDPGQPGGSGPRPRAGGFWRGLLGSTGRGARRGFWWATYIFGPIAALLLVPGLALCAFAAGTGRGLPFVPRWIGPLLGRGPFLAGMSMPGLIYLPFRFYLGFALLGTMLGAGIGLFGGLAGRLLRRFANQDSRWRAWLVRPRGVARKRQGPDETVAPAAPHRWRRRAIWLGGSLLAVLLAVSFMLGVYTGKRVERRLAAAIAAAERDDPYWRMDDLMAHREPLPPEENSALVVAEAVAQLPEGWPGAPPAAPGVPSLPAGPALEAFDALTAAENVQLDPTAAETLRGELTKYPEAVRLARRVADFDRGRHELELGPTLLDTPLTETQASRTLARLLQADAAIRAQDGDLDGALDSCRAIVGVGRSIGDEPFLISHLVRIALGSTARIAVQRVVGQGEPSDMALERLQRLLLDELNQPYLVHALRGERAMLTELLRRVGEGEMPISALSEGAAALDPARRQMRIGGWIRIWFDYQRAVALDWFNQAVAIAKRPAPEQLALWDALDARVARVKASRYGIYTSMLALLLFPSISSGGKADLHYKSSLGVTVLLIAAERDRRRTGRWPGAVAAIAPEILADPPRDPYSGQPYRIEQRDGRFTVYSIGLNRKDEHGAFDPKRSRTGGADDTAAHAWDPALRCQAPSSRPDREPGTP